MLEAEQAAELVQQRSAEEDWLPAAVPSDTRLRAIPTHVTMAGSVYLHTYPNGERRHHRRQSAAAALVR